MSEVAADLAKLLKRLVKLPGYNSTADDPSELVPTDWEHNLVGFKDSFRNKHYPLFKS